MPRARKGALALRLCLKSPRSTFQVDVSACYAAVSVIDLHECPPSGRQLTEATYRFNVEVAGAARLYRAASEWTAGLCIGWLLIR